MTVSNTIPVHIDGSDTVGYTDARILPTRGGEILERRTADSIDVDCCTPVPDRPHDSSRSYT
jgi:hypothetical protein